MLYVDLVFIIILSVYCYWIWGMVRALSLDAPYVPMKPLVVARLVELAQAPQNGLWIDLGSGDGRVLIAACRRYPTIRAIGIEKVSTIRWWSRLRILYAGLSKRIQIVRGDLFALPIGDADVMSMYLLTETMKKMWVKIQTEAKPGATIVWHRFPLDVPLERSDESMKIYVAKR